MRDPGTQRRNPLFAPEEPPEIPEDPAPSIGEDSVYGIGAGALPPVDGLNLDVIVGAVMAAGPETAEHLLAAAQELLLAAKAVVDAGERLVDSSRDGQPGESAEPATAPTSGADESAPWRRLDFA
jgi:hypothetical protein